MNKLIGIFVPENQIDQNIELIKYKFSNPSSPSKLYLFDTDLPTESLITFNTNGLNDYTIQGSISLHRNKTTNTLFTLNSLNTVIKLQNGNFLDPTFKVDWSEYQSCCLIGRLNKLKVIRTKISEIIEI